MPADTTTNENKMQSFDIEPDMLRFAVQAAGSGIWQVWHSDPEVLLWDDACKTAHGLAAGENIPYAEVANLIHEADREAVNAAVQKALDRNGDGKFDMLYRSVAKNDGSVRWIRSIGRTNFGDGSRPVYLAGILRDITKEFTEREEINAKRQQELEAARALKETEGHFRTLVEQAPVAIGLLSGRDMVVTTVNKPILQAWGKNESIIGLPLIEALPELKGQPFMDLLEGVYDSGIAHYAYAMAARLERNGRMEDVYSDFVYTPMRDAEGNVNGVMVLATIVTEQVLARKALEESELRLRSFVDSAPFPIGVYTGREMRIILANQAMMDTWGKGNDVVGKLYTEILPELDNQEIFEQLADVYETGIPFHAKNTRVDLVVDGILQPFYFNYSFTPVFDLAGNVYGVMNTGANVTDLNLAKQKVEESEDRFRSLIEQAPMATCVFVGRDLKIEVANDALIAMWGKTRDVIGKPLEEALPEAKGQSFMQILDDVFTSGIAYSSTEFPADLEVNGVRSTYYFNFTYKPLLDAAGAVYGIMDMAVDVTEQVLSRRKIEEAEASLRGAVELAELGTWELDLSTRTMDYSPRMRNWFGFEDDELITIENGYSAIAISDHHLIRESMTRAIDTNIRSPYDVEYTTINKLTGRQQIIHAQGKAIFNDKNEAIRVTGTAQDVTEQRKVQLALEHEVQLRTEELAASNEEMAAINDELHETNERLMHSNEELAQYAYVASHDLQEPLRKIQVFSDILENRGDLKDGDKALLKKIGQSSVRMTMLIKDLLNFSRLLQSDSMMQPVNLATVIDAVVNDFELTIVEQKAVIEIGPMPVIEAIQLQMNQLFYNLLSNALKFIDAGKVPHISISAQQISHEEAKRYIPKAMSHTHYYKLAVTDNGIGFENKYADQIFEVFKRLHTKEMFAGSGVGLALCRRIMDNHNGYIYVESEPGVGTTFNVIFPAGQSDKA